MKMDVMVDPPIAIIMATAVKIHIKGTAKLMAPRPFEPTPRPTKIPSTTKYNPVTIDAQTDGITN